MVKWTMFDVMVFGLAGKTIVDGRPAAKGRELYQGHIYN